MDTSDIDASKIQLNILVEHHKRKLKTTEERIQQVTCIIQDNSTSKQIAKQSTDTSDNRSHQ